MKEKAVLSCLLTTHLLRASNPLLDALKLYMLSLYWLYSSLVFLLVSKKVLSAQRVPRLTSYLCK